MIKVLCLPVAFIIDCVVGDPQSEYHPVVLIGKMIGFLDRQLRTRWPAPWQQRLSGALLVALVLGIVYLTAVLLITLLERFTSDTVTLLGNAVLLSFAISPRSLATAGREIQQLLEAGRLAEARSKVGWIVGRDTDRLNAGEVTRATVETVAENIVDGIISPLFYAAIGGVEMAWVYRAVNTMDSMLGYKNDKYLHFGLVAARTDDLFNFIPARLTAVLLVISAAILGYDARRAAKTAWRDASKHPSPNSGWSEAAVAGALGIRLGGINYYGGVASYRAEMGEALYPLQASHIACTVKLMYTATGLFILLASGWLYLGI